MHIDQSCLIVALPSHDQNPPLKLRCPVKRAAHRSSSYIVISSDTKVSAISLFKSIWLLFPFIRSARQKCSSFVLNGLSNHARIAGWLKPQSLALFHDRSSAGLVAACCREFSSCRGFGISNHRNVCKH